MRERVINIHRYILTNSHLSKKCSSINGQKLTSVPLYPGDPAKPINPGSPLSPKQQKYKKKHTFNNFEY